MSDVRNPIIEKHLYKLKQDLLPLGITLDGAAYNRIWGAMQRAMDDAKDTSLLREGEQYMRHKLNCTHFDEITDTKKKQYCGPCDCGLSAHLEKLKSRIK